MPVPIIYVSLFILDISFKVTLVGSVRNNSFKKESQTLSIIFLDLNGFSLSVISVNNCYSILDIPLYFYLT